MKSSRTRSSFVIFFYTHSSCSEAWQCHGIEAMSACVPSFCLIVAPPHQKPLAIIMQSPRSPSACWNVGICCAFFSVDSQRRIHSLDWDSRAGGARGFSEWGKTLGVVSSACGFECVPVCWQTNYSCYFQIIWGHNLGVCPSRSLCVFLPFKWSTLVGFPSIPAILEN